MPQMPDIGSLSGSIPGMSAFAQKIPDYSSLGGMMPGRQARSADAEPEV